MRKAISWRTLLLAGLPLLTLGGCASLSQDGGFAPVQQAAEQYLAKTVQIERANEPNSIDQRVGELLARPLSADSAVQIALLNNRGLQASFQSLGIAEAEMVQASRLPNPGVSLSRLQRGDEREIERKFTLDLAHLIALPLTRELEAKRFAAVQRSVVLNMLALAAETRKAFYAAVAAEQTEAYRRDVRASADAGAELAKRLAQTGSWNQLQQAREHGFYSEAALNLLRAEQARVASRERLTRLLGLWGAQTQFSLPARLPDLPQAPQERPALEQEALAQRLDVQAARLQVEQTAKHLGLSKVTRFINVLELGYEHNSANQGQARQTGYEIGFEIPLFDWGDARIAKAEAVYMQSVQRAAQAAIEARSELREAYLGYRNAYEIARHYRDDVVPTAKRVSDQNLLRYNGMFISVFELLADARAQIGAVNASIEALRDFWTAQADLDMALIGKPSFSPLSAAATPVAGAAAAH